MSPTPSQPRILIIRLTALGDVVQAHEALKSVLPILPPCHWAWAVAAPYTSLIAGEEGVDELISVPRRWSLKSWLAFRRAQRGQTFDLIIDAQCLIKSWLVRATFSSKKTLSWGPSQSRDWFAPKLYGHQLNEAPVSSRAGFLALIERGITLLDSPSGSDSPSKSPLVMSPSTAKLRQDFRIICAVGAGWPTKQLSMDAWEPLLAAVRKDCPSRELCFLTGTDSEKEELEEAWPRLEKMDICLLPNLNLKDLKEFLRPGDLFIGMDSGPTHLASSRGCLTLTFFGASLPEAYDRGGAGAHAPRGVCHLRETFERRCDRLRDCQRCSAIDSIDVVTAWRNFWTSIEPPS